MEFSITLAKPSWKDTNEMNNRQQQIDPQVKLLAMLVFMVACFFLFSGIGTLGILFPPSLIITVPLAIIKIRKAWRRNFNIQGGSK
jgi:hypothetical protein